MTEISNQLQHLRAFLELAVQPESTSEVVQHDFYAAYCAYCYEDQSRGEPLKRIKFGQKSLEIAEDLWNIKPTKRAVLVGNVISGLKVTSQGAFYFQTGSENKIRKTTSTKGAGIFKSGSFREKIAQGSLSPEQKVYWVFRNNRDKEELAKFSTKA